MKKYYVILLSIIFCSCKKESVWYVTTHQYDATLKVSVYLQNDSIIDKTPLRYAIISIYETEYDRSMHQNSKYTNQTDVNGYAPFYHLSGYHYYISVWHYLYGAQEDEITTQDAVTTNLEVIYH